jgi:hypothetical protein
MSVSQTARASSSMRCVTAGRRTFICRPFYSPERRQKRDLRSLISSGVGDRRQVPFDNRNLELRVVRSPLQFSPSPTGPLSRAVSSPMVRRHSQPRSGCNRCRAIPPRSLALARRPSLSVLSARTQNQPGLAAVFDAHEASREKFPNERKAGTPAGNLAARERNAR